MSFLAVVRFIIISTFLYTLQYGYASDIGTPKTIKLNEFADFFAQRIKIHFDLIFNSAKRHTVSDLPNNCSRPKDVFEHMNITKERGDFSTCFNLARICKGHKAFSQSQQENDIEVEEHVLSVLSDIMMTGGDCGRNLFLGKEAKAFSYLACDNRFVKTPDYPGKLYYLAYRSKHESNEIKYNILKKNPLWSDEEIELLLDMINYYNPQNNEVYSKEKLMAIEKFTTEVLNGDSPTFKETLTLSLVEKSNFNSRLHTLKKNINYVSSPHKWFEYVYITLYESSKDGDFSNVIKLYQSYMPYANLFSWMPLERNPYTYSQLSNSVCAANLTRKSIKEKMNNIEHKWLKGELKLDIALRQIRELNDRYPQKADLLTFQGTLLAMIGLKDLALDAFWQAHLSCPYYNRAHVGLMDIRKLEDYRLYDDFKQIEEQVFSELKGVSISPLISKYVVNWSVFSLEEQERIKYSLRFFSGIIDDIFLTTKVQYRGNFFQVSNRLYIKMTHQKLSEVPGLGHVKDTRIKYQFDYRLWDDIRGLGGAITVADLNKILLAPWSGEDLIAHEVAHQLFIALPQKMKKCIERLFINAAGRSAYINTYSQHNSEEYFAEGVRFYLRTNDSYLRFGNRKRAWLEKYDNDLATLLGSIEKAQSLEEIHCPLK